MTSNHAAAVRLGLRFDLQPIVGAATVSGFPFHFFYKFIYMKDIDEYYTEVIKDDLPPFMEEQCKRELEITTAFAVWKLRKSFRVLKDSILFYFFR